MKLINKITKYFLTPLVVVLMSGCDMFDLDINTDPNNPASASALLLLPQVQYNLANSFCGTPNSSAHGFAGLISSSDDFNVANTSYSGFWDNIYAGPLQDLESLITRSTTDGLSHHLAVAQLLKAYAFSTMVNIFGDVPYSEAFKGNEVSGRAPHFDDDQAVFNNCLALIDQALLNFAKASPIPLSTNGADLIYGGSVPSWQKFANSLKVKLLLESFRARSGVKAELAAALALPQISASAEDFKFTFSKLVNPDNRHPWYQGTYTGGEFTYISHQLMVEMLQDGDPRWPFYFRRQTKGILDQNDPTAKSTTPCWSTPGCKYGYIVLNAPLMETLFNADGSGISAAEIDFAAGMFGRDRSDRSGVPQDGSFRTIPGVFPAGGFYDVTAPALAGTNTAPGGGNFYMLTDVNVLYYNIEAILEDKIGLDGGDAIKAGNLFSSAMRKHIDKVVKFGQATDTKSVAPTAAAIDAYVAKWMDRYNNATSNKARLNVVMKQLWVSSWGNGFEIYNAMRRTYDPGATNTYGYTGFPNTIQEPVQASGRKFPNRFPYPQSEITLNANAPKDVIWDNDDPNFRLFWDIKD